MLKMYRADRAFDGFDAGQEVELDPDREWDARQIATGYLEEIGAPAAGDDQADAPAETPAVDLSATTTSDTPTTTADVEVAPATGTTKVSRRKAAPGEGNGTAGPVGGPVDSGQ